MARQRICAREIRHDVVNRRLVVRQNDSTVSSIFPYPALAVFQESRGALTTAFGYFSASRLALTAQGETDAVKGQYVSGGYFDGMGVVPAAGRLLQPQDDNPGDSAVAVLSDRFTGADSAARRPPSARQSASTTSRSA
jgi:hypothetical protein